MCDFFARVFFFRGLFVGGAFGGGGGIRALVRGGTVVGLCDERRRLRSIGSLHRAG